MVCDMIVTPTGIDKNTVLSGGVPLEGPPHLYAGVELAFGCYQPGRGAKAPNRTCRRSLRLYQISFAKARGQARRIDFETTETMMLFNDQGKIENIIPVVRNDATA